MLKPGAEFDYNSRVRELFAHLQHAGSLATVSDVAKVVSASAGARQQGAGVELFAEIRQAAHIHTVRYQAYGCPHFLAACECLAIWLEGRAIREIGQWHWRDVEAELQVPSAKRARLLLLDDALQALHRKLTT